MSKIYKRGGFTLAELLIVIAIMSILVAIAIPAFSAQLEHARAAVDRGNLRSAESMCVFDYLLNYRAGELTYEVYVNDNNMNVYLVGDTTARSGIPLKGQTDGLEDLKITVLDGEVTSTTWGNVLSSYAT